MIKTYAFTCITFSELVVPCIKTLSPQVAIIISLFSTKFNFFAITSAVAEGSADISGRLNAKLIVVGTESGRAARDMRRYFPKANILAITNNEKTANQLVLSRGIIPYVDASPKTLEEFFVIAEAAAKKLNLVENNDIIIATGGESVFIQGTTNSIKVIQVKA